MWTAGVHSSLLNCSSPLPPAALCLARYLAPEALKSRDFLTSGLADRLDVFALGASVYELLRGTELPKNGQGYHDVRQGKLFLPSCSTRIINLLKVRVAACGACCLLLPKLCLYAGVKWAGTVVV